MWLCMVGISLAYLWTWIARWMDRLYSNPTPLTHTTGKVTLNYWQLKSWSKACTLTLLMSPWGKPFPKDIEQLSLPPDFVPQAWWYIGPGNVTLSTVPSVDTWMKPHDTSSNALTPSPGYMRHCYLQVSKRAPKNIEQTRTSLKKFLRSTPMETTVPPWWPKHTSSETTWCMILSHCLETSTIQILPILEKLELYPKFILSTSCKQFIQNGSYNKLDEKGKWLAIYSIIASATIEQQLKPTLRKGDDSLWRTK